MKHPCQELVGNILNTVCATAETIERFRTKKEGCIRITFYPSNAVANSWLGGFLYASNFVPDLEITYPILPGGDRVARFDEKDEKGNPIVVEVDTYTITAAKNAAISRFQDEGILQSGVKKLKGLCMENGFAPWKGAIATEIYDESGGRKIPFCGVYVSVSGGTENEDLLCSASAIPVILNFFKEEGMKADAPLIDPELLRDIINEEKREET